MGSLFSQCEQSVGLRTTQTIEIGSVNKTEMPKSLNTANRGARVCGAMSLCGARPIWFSGATGMEQQHCRVIVANRTTKASEVSAF